MEQMEAMDIDRDQGDDEGNDDAVHDRDDMMPTEEQAAFHRRPSR